MKPNLTLIGMPGAGKSTVGILLAKQLAWDFVDTDVLIQVREGRSLQEILDDHGHLHLRRVEEQAILSLAPQRHVIATGGSAAYSEAAMRHLRGLSTVVFLQVRYETILRRVHDFETRGIAKAPEQSFRDLYAERQALYRRYAGITLDADDLDQEQVAMALAGRVAELSSAQDGEEGG